MISLSSNIKPVIIQPKLRKKQVNSTIGRSVIKKITPAIVGTIIIYRPRYTPSFLCWRNHICPTKICFMELVYVGRTKKGISIEERTKILANNIGPCGVRM